VLKGGGLPPPFFFPADPLPGSPPMQSTATGPVPAAPVRAGRPQAVSCLRHSLAPIAREAGPAFPGSRSPRLDIRGVAGGEGL